MSEPKQRGGAGRGQGRKALAGEVRKVRPVKMTDGEWDDFKRVTPERVRKWVAKESAKLRKAEESNVLVGTPKEMEALRRLEAAAPDLLAALERMVDLFDPMHMDPQGLTAGGAACLAARAAIKKATQ